MTSRTAPDHLKDNAARALAAGAVLLLPAAARPDTAVAVAALFLLAVVAARLSAARVRRWPPTAAYVLVLSVTALCVGLAYQALLALQYALASDLRLVAGLLLANPAVYLLALGRRDGTDVDQPPALTLAAIPTAVLLGVALIATLAGPTLAIVGEPPGLLLCGGLLLAATRVARRDNRGA